MSLTFCFALFSVRFLSFYYFLPFELSLSLGLNLGSYLCLRNHRLDLLGYSVTLKYDGFFLEHVQRLVNCGHHPRA